MNMSMKFYLELKKNFLETQVLVCYKILSMIHSFDHVLLHLMLQYYSHSQSFVF